MQRLRLEKPELARQAIAVSAGDGRSERVVACSAEAQRLGVQVGAKTPDAQALAGPGSLQIALHEPGSDRRRLERLADACQRFSPTVALVDVASADPQPPDALLMDITGLAPLWANQAAATCSNGELLLAQQVLAWARQQRLQAVVAVAPTVPATYAAARYCRWLEHDPDQPLLLPDACQQQLAWLPIDALGLNEATTETLAHLGVDTVGKLLQLPRASLRSRFGGAILQRIDQLTGVAHTPLIAHKPLEPLTASWAYESAVSSSEVLCGTVDRLLEKVAARMKSQRCGALRAMVVFQLDTPKGGAAEERIVLRLFRPTTAAQELGELAALQLDRLRFRCAVRTIRVFVGSTAPIERRQRTLFEQEASDAPHELALLVNRLASRLGAERVLRVQKRRSIDPSRACVYLPATDVRGKAFAMTPTETLRYRRLPLCRSIDGGERVRVRADPVGVPTMVKLSGWRQVVRVWGPERVETGWWRGHGMRRDAFWIELRTGEKHWLTHDLRTGDWRLAGGLG